MIERACLLDSRIIAHLLIESKLGNKCKLRVYLHFLFFSETDKLEIKWKDGRKCINEQ